MSIPQSGGGPIESYDQLAGYLEDGCKPKEDWSEILGKNIDTPCPFVG